MSRRSLRNDSPDTQLLSPYPNPDHRHPDTWNSRSYHNWQMYMQPIHDRLADTGQIWYRRIYRPLHSTGGVRERRDISAWTEEDYVAERVATNVFDAKSFQLPSRRQVARVRADADLDDIAAQISRAIKTVMQQRPSGQPPTVDVDADVDSDSLPLTPTIAVGHQRKPR